jgi:putative endonuclease
MGTSKYRRSGRSRQRKGVKMKEDAEIERYIGCMPTLNEPIAMDSPLPSARLSSIARARRWSLAVERWVLLHLQGLALRSGRIRPDAQHLAIGKRGELEALFFLRAQGYRMAERRWRSRGLNGDLDLVAWDGETLAVVEVKTRTRRDFFAAESTINEVKRKMLFRMAQAYTRSIPEWEKEPAPLRFDVVAVYLIEGKVDCILTRNAFSLERWTRGE